MPGTPGGHGLASAWWHSCRYGGRRRRVRWPQLSCGPRAGPYVPVTSEPWDAARELGRGRAGPGLVRVLVAAAGLAFRFVLVSVLRGQCPWLSVRSGGWEPASTDI